MKRREAKEEAEKAVTKLKFVFSNYIQLEPAIHERRKRNTHTRAYSKTKAQHKYASIRFMAVKWIASSFDSEFSSSDSDLICVFLRCQTLCARSCFSDLRQYHWLIVFGGGKNHFGEALWGKVESIDIWPKSGSIIVITCLNV